MSVAASVHEGPAAGPTDDPPLTPEQMTGLLRELVQLEDSLKTVGDEIREKRKRLRVVKSMVIRGMKSRHLVKYDLTRSGKVLLRFERPVKAPLTQAFLTDTLTEFFRGDRTQAAACIAFLNEHRPTKTADKLVLKPATGSTAGSTLSE